MKAKSMNAVLACLLAGLALNAGAADQQRDRVHQPTQGQSAAAPDDQARKPEVIYGSQLMTHKERREYQAKMRSLKTPEEREAFRKQHHEEMKARAKQLGKTLPDEPPAQGKGMGPGMGPGGMGPGKR